MMAWLIAVPIGPYAPVDIMCTRDILWEDQRKERIQTGTKQISAHQIYQSLHVVRYRPMILHGKSFGNISPAVHRSGALISHRSKRCTPRTVGCSSTHILGFGIEKVPVIKRTFKEEVCRLDFSQRFCSLINGIVVVCILESLRCTTFRYFQTTKTAAFVPHFYRNEPAKS